MTEFNVNMLIFVGFLGSVWYLILNEIFSAWRKEDWAKAYFEKGDK